MEKKSPVQGEHKRSTAGRDWFSTSRMKRKVRLQRKPHVSKARKGVDGEKKKVLEEVGKEGRGLPGTGR